MIVHTCETCNALFVCLKYYHEHRKKHADNEGRTIFPCTHCQIIHETESESYLHSLSHKNEPPHSCEICQATQSAITHNTSNGPESARKGKGNRKARLSTDIARVFELKFSCCHCGKSFKTKSHLQRHILTHTGERPYHCNRCDCRFNQSSSLRNHVIAIHTKEFPHTCNNCGKGFLMPAVLLRHLQTSECGKIGGQVIEGL